MREGGRDSPGITHDLKKVHKFDVLVIDERSDRALSVINKLGFAHHFVVDAVGGGCLIRDGVARLACRTKKEHINNPGEPP